MSSPPALNAFSHYHPWNPSAIRLAPTASLLSAHTSITHQLWILDCRGHDARDMQRTLNYITAELRMRKAEDLALAEANRKNSSEESNVNNKADEEKNKDIGEFRPGSWVKKIDGGLRMTEMEGEDKRWEKKHGGNPRWGEGRTAHLYGK